MARLQGYPTREQFMDAAGLAIEIVREGSIIERKAEFGAATWNVWGFLQSFLLSNPPLSLGGDEHLPPLTELRVVLAGVLEDGPPRANADWTLIMEIIRMILKLIDLLRSE